MTRETNINTGVNGFPLEAQPGGAERLKAAIKQGLKVNKQAELDRLRLLVFEGAPDWANWAVMENPEWTVKELQHAVRWWSWHKEKPKCDGEFRWLSFNVHMGCKNQPATDLDWTETLIER